MDRIYNPDRLEDDRRFFEGDFELGIDATPLAATFLNDVQEEICGVIEGAGMTLEPDNQAQLLAAIKALTKTAVQSTQVQTYTKSGTFFKPAGAKSIHLLLIGGGQGGASGTVSAVDADSLGGIGGIGGARLEVMLDAALFPESCAVIVGLGGAGGASSTGAGLPGKDATESVVKIGKSQYSACGGNSINNTAVFPGGRGGDAILRGNGGAGSGGAPGGAAGGSVMNGTGWPGGYGAFSLLNHTTNKTVHSHGGFNGGDALHIPNSDEYAAYKYPGVSGGGGGGGGRQGINGEKGGRGADGGLYGAGGGGGGATLAGGLSGSGGNGADGVVVITIFF